MKHQKSRNAHAAAILGPELHSRLQNTRVLLVGAGGIGCELCKFARLLQLQQRYVLNVWQSVKNIVMTGFGHITLLDLDTIDLSNLNRQFLFRKKDVKQSKALVRSTVSD
jgi:ubiquitin-like 1-activating enzyme E1 B